MDSGGKDNDFSAISACRPAAAGQSISNVRAVSLSAVMRTFIVFVREQLFDLLGPLHQAEVARVEVLLVAEVVGLALVRSMR